jgi:hypothetical protein
MDHPIERQAVSAASFEYDAKAKKTITTASANLAPGIVFFILSPYWLFLSNLRASIT